VSLAPNRPRKTERTCGVLTGLDHIEFVPVSWCFAGHAANVFRRCRILRFRSSRWLNLNTARASVVDRTSRGPGHTLNNISSQILPINRRPFSTALEQLQKFRLSDDRNAKRLRFFQLRSGFFAGKHIAGLFAHGAAHLASCGLDPR